jgi:hypothetical protein
LKTGGGGSWKSPTIPAALLASVIPFTYVGCAVSLVYILKGKCVERCTVSTPGEVAKHLWMDEVFDSPGATFFSKV